ncbi:MAG: hypothetical protein ACRDWD_17135 [Acidimicrobiia bacterium]
MAITRSRWTRRAVLAPVAIGMVALLGACQPDLFIRKSGSGGPYKGKGVINGTAAGQTETRRQRVGRHALYDFKLHNLPEGQCAIQITDGALTNGGAYLRKYTYQGQSVTERITSTQGYTITLPSNGKSDRFRLKVTPESGAVGNEQVLVIAAKCQSDTNLLDRIKAITKIR